MAPLNVNLLKNNLITLFKEKCQQEELELCGESVVSLFNCLVQKSMADPTNPSIQQQQQVEALIDLANERLLMYPYKDVPSCWRSLLMDASLLQAFGLLTVMEQQEANITTTNELGRQVIKIVDTALVVSGCPGDKRRQLTLELLNTLQSWLRPPSSGTNHHRLLTLDAAAPLPTLQHPIPILHQPPDYLWFEAHINQVPMATPLRLCGLMDHWPACSSRPWNDLDYLLQMTGDRIVPIEIGLNYTDPSWQQKMVRMEDFIHNYILSPLTTAYLAQHNLFDHIPLLANDISIPEYCYVDPKPSQWYSSEPPDVIQHAWFGPKGTVSPLHQDPYHNLLAQVVGRKYIRLYAPTLSQALYPFDGMMSNTSQVDLDSPDLDAYPLFAQAEYLECILEPGEMLYIPPKWWHYVRSLDTSFSVSFWF